MLSLSGLQALYAEDYKGFTEGVPVAGGTKKFQENSDDVTSHDQHFIYIDHAYFNRGHGNSYRIST